MESGRTAAPGGFSTLPPGVTIDRYRIERVLASGGFGITYMCRHTALDRLVALKEHFPRQFAYREAATSEVRPTDPETFTWALDRFIQEGRALARCNHPNVVSVSDVFEANGTAYMVLGFEQGTSLKAWLDRLGRPPTQAEIDTFLPPLLDALAYVHGQGLLHRDIAPDNIMIRDDGTPCLIDFGAARQAVAERSQMMSAIVKSGYSPPEQYTRSGRAQGPWSDIYALSATLFRALTGETPQEATDRQVDDELPPVRERLPARHDYRSGLLDGIDRGLQLRYANRPQSIEDWRQTLMAGGEGRATGIEPTLLGPFAGQAVSPDRPPATRPPDTPPTPRPAAADDNVARAGAEVQQDAPPPVIPGADGPVATGPAAPRRVAFDDLKPVPASSSSGRSRIPLLIGLAGLAMAGTAVVALWDGDRSDNPPAIPPTVGASIPQPPTPVPNGRISLTNPINWKVSSSFPKSEEASWTILQNLTKTAADRTGGQFQIQAYAAGEIVPALQVLQAVGTGIIEGGLAPARYYHGPGPAFMLASGGLPLGIPGRAYWGWATGPGQSVRDKLFAKHGVKGIACGIGGQKGLWSRRALTSPESLKGLKVRLSGASASALSRTGLSPQLLPGGEIYPALERGILDATEFAAPSFDAKLGFGKVAKYYYYPSWGPDFGYIIDFLVNLNVWNGLSNDVQRLVEQSCALSDFDPIDRTGLIELSKQGVTPTALPTSIVERVQREAIAFVTEKARSDVRLKEMWDSLQTAR